MGIEPYLISSSLAGVVAQRLVRTVCSECKTTYVPSRSLLEEMGWNEEKGIRLVKGKGCPACYDSGYKGRMGIFELMTADAELKSLLLRNPSVEEIREFQQTAGRSSLRQEGLAKARENQTTLEEVFRAVYVE
jgi:type II secretory ATPase GspE/PulE/Tfp pilus assembly ATPase PilB-like protein